MTAAAFRLARSIARKSLPAVLAAAALAAAVPLAVHAAEKPKAADAAKPADDKKPAAAADITAIAKEGYWGEPDNWAKHEPLLGKPAPKLELSDWINGGEAAKGLKDKIVVVDFWATWCGPCLKAVPHNNEVAKKYADKGVILIGACGGGGEQNMAARAEQTKMGYPVAKVTKESTDAWQVQWWPTYAVVDRKGNLRAIGLKPDAVEKVIDALLAEQPAAAEKK